MQLFREWGVIREGPCRNIAKIVARGIFSVLVWGAVASTAEIAGAARGKMNILQSSLWTRKAVVIPDKLSLSSCAIIDSSNSYELLFDRVIR